MNPESDTVLALKRALQRATYHLIRAGIEGLRAIEAVADELAQVGKRGDDDDQRVQIEVE
jgi:hypothetical protein